MQQQMERNNERGAHSERNRDRDKQRERKTGRKKVGETERQTDT